MLDRLVSVFEASVSRCISFRTERPGAKWGIVNMYDIGSALPPVQQHQERCRVVAQGASTKPMGTDAQTCGCALSCSAYQSKVDPSMSTLLGTATS